MKKRITAKHLFIIALVLVLVGSILSNRIMTVGGTVQLKDINIVTDEGNLSAGLLFIPDAAYEEDAKLPAVLVVHGGNSTRTCMNAYSIELARRGYVVLGLDQSRNGGSDRELSEQNGTYFAIQYLDKLDFVDSENIGLLSHSAGGCVFTAAEELYLRTGDPIAKSFAGNGALPYALKYEGSDLPVNIMYNLGRYDESCSPNGSWGIPGPAYTYEAPVLLKMFGIPDGETIEYGKYYGNREDNTLRVLLQPNTYHKWMLWSTESVANNVWFMNDTLDGGLDIDPNNQIWMWNTIGSVMAYVGLFLAVFSLIAILYKKPYYAETVHAVVPGQMTSNIRYWVCVLVVALLPVWFLGFMFDIGKKFFTGISSKLFMLEHINGIFFWQMSVVLVVLLVNLFMKKFVNKTYDWEKDFAVFKADWKTILRSFVAALSVFGIAYLIAYLSYFLFKNTITMVFTEVDLFTPMRFGAFLVYLPLYIIYYLINGYIQTTGLRTKNQSTLSFYIRTILLNAAGVLVYTICFYASVPIQGYRLNLMSAIISMTIANFVPSMMLAGGIQVYCFRKTGKIYLGAFVNALLLTWMTSASVCMITLAGGT